MRNIIIYLFLPFIFFSCTERSNIRTKIDNNLETGKLVIYDSIDLPEYRFSHITDYNPNTETFIGLFQEKIIGFKSHEKAFTIDKHGDGPEEYFYDFPIFTNAKFATDTSFMINCYNKLKFFSLKGEFLKDQRINDEPFYYERYPQACVDDSIVVFIGDNELPKDPEGPVEKRSCKKFFFLNMNTGKYKSYGTLEKENHLKVVNKYMPLPSPEGIFNKEKKCLDLIYSADAQLFRYHMDDPTKYEYIKLTPEYTIEPYLLANDFKAVTGHPSELKNRLRNNYYKQCYSSGDTLITAYQPGVSQELIEKELGEGSDATIKKGGYFGFINNFCESYIEYYINEEKQIHDIKIPNHYKVEYIGDSEHILIRDPNREITSNKKALKRYYLCRIEKKQS
ncbi:MAG: hypothetical protein ACEPOV_12950 [Hyphomicrobiales bacterium]